jgi:CTP:molybdopterin cytidylyltransferase MocA
MAGRRNGGVAGVLLAAGAGSRLGRPKALLRLDGELLVERGVRLLVAGGCDPVLVVVGAAAAAVRAEAALPPAAQVVQNPLWQTGMGSSLRTGLAAVPAEAGAAVVALVDQPRVSPEAVRRLIAAWRGGAAVAVATYRGQQRNPVLLSRGVLADAAAAAAGDRGARDWLREHPDLVVPVPCDGAGDPFDIDTPGDLGTLAASGGDLEE